MKRKLYSGLLPLIVLAALCLPFSLYAADAQRGLSQGQILYVPAYSDIYIGDSERPFQLTITLSLRNIDPKYQITIESVNYYETRGKFLKSYVDHPVTLEALETLRFVIPEKDKSGGSGANFIVVWKSDKMVNPPIIESVMIGSRSQQGISFASRGQELIPHD
ncbi:DUF3124 domain-containing protein [Desulfosediminicola flagellatus]|uniref:DUF3124 domain-containing protein n=1 Tax=Desulfosediminicola flagellatus TaxID=2569541 RepID=UPI0010ACC298|nr:DUF3124 domain-containing protein [Desulfosediminicola flagellatus]